MTTRRPTTTSTAIVVTSRSGRSGRSTCCSRVDAPGALRHAGTDDRDLRTRRGRALPESPEAGAHALAVRAALPPLRVREGRLPPRTVHAGAACAVGEEAGAGDARGRAAARGRP